MEEIIEVQKDEPKENIENVTETQRESTKAMNGILGAFIFAVLFGGGAWGIYQFYQYVFGKVLFWIIIMFMVISIMVGVSCFVDWKSAIQIEKIEQDARQEEKEFLEIDPSKRALKAEKMFKMNQKELMRYYDMNLAQTKFVSGLGIMMIIFGILIVGITLILYVYMNSDKTLLFVGNISGIIVDFVGAVFIKMYTQNVKAAVRFHSKFAESNNLLLANSIANKIENDELRELTLSEIAKEIVCSKSNNNAD